MEKPIFTEEEALALRKKYNPDGSLLRQQQMELLEMLKVLGDICDKNHIQWWLSSGTLLGAARHQGFVPWDDDVDIVMFKKDFNRLEKILERMQDDTFVLHSMKTDIEYVRVFNKFRKREGKELSHDRRCGHYKWGGSYIDIFVIEKTSYTAALLSGFIYKNLVYLTAYLKTRWLRCILNRVIEVLCLGILNPIFRLVGLINPKGEYHYKLGMGWARSTYHKEDILPLGKATFEGAEFPVPHNMDKYLKGIYGDWRQLPSEKTIRRNIHRLAYIEEIYGKAN